jgi:hypothetical protein
MVAVDMVAVDMLTVDMLAVDLVAVDMLAVDMLAVDLVTGATPEVLGRVAGEKPEVLGMVAWATPEVLKKCLGRYWHPWSPIAGLTTAVMTCQPHCLRRSESAVFTPGRADSLKAR